MNAALRRPRARGSLVVAGNLSAIGAWVAGTTYWQLMLLSEQMADEFLGSLAVALVAVVLWPVMVGGLAVAIVAAAFTLPLGVVWAMSDDQPVVPGLSFAHAIVAWAVVPTLLITRA